MERITKRRWRGGLALGVALLLLTACSQTNNDGNGNKGNEKPIVTPVAGGLLGNGYTDASYLYGNSTNLYKMLGEDIRAEKDSNTKGNAAFAQYDLEGNYVQKIAPAGGTELLLSVDDSWLYYEAERQDKTVICRLPVTKQDGRDVIDTSKEEILFGPENISEEEKTLGISEKVFEWSDICFITPKYVIAAVETDAGEDEDNDGKDEIIRYNLQTKEFTYKLYPSNSVTYGWGYVSASGDTLILCDEDSLNLLDVETLNIGSLWDSEDFWGEMSDVLLTPDGNTFCYLTAEDLEATDTWVTIYSLEEKSLRLTVPPKKLQQAVCQAEGAEEKTVLNTAYAFLGCYKEKIYLRYLFEQEQGSDRSAHYGVLSLSLDDGELSYEKEMSEAVQRESVPFHGQWIRYQKLGKEEKEAAKREGKKPEQTIEKQYQLTVNLGNPQRIIGNQLFFRSINQETEKNGWFCYCLDTKKQEKLSAGDARNQWIYMQSCVGWDSDTTYLSPDGEMLCTDDYDDDDLVKVVWDAVPTEKSAANSGQEIPVQEQLQYIAGHRYEWIRKMCGYASEGSDSYDDVMLGEYLNYLNFGNGMKYIVTDLNQNGRLEVIALDVSGSGCYTNIYAYEYSYKTQSLEPLWEQLNFGTVPDIGYLKKTDVYYDKKHKMHWYFSTDYTHVSGEENYDALCLWGVDSKGKFCSSTYGYSEISYSDEKSVSYYIEDKKVDKKEFTKKKKNMEPDMKKGKATLRWQQDGQALVEMSEEALLEKLTKSWEGFFIKY